MNAPQDAYVPVPVRQRHMVVGDVFIGQNGKLWTVAATRPGHLSASLGATTRGADIDPDTVFQVLTPVPEVQAATIARDVLGAQLIARRNADETPGAAA